MRFTNGFLRDRVKAGLKGEFSVITVRVVKYWQFPDLRRQTPAEDGRWNEILVTEHPVEDCDYLLLLGIPKESFSVRCSPKNVWMVCQEPPTEGFRYLHGGHPACARVYTQDIARRGPRFFHSQPALPWFVNRNYSTLKTQTVPDKSRSLSWVTSNKALLKGHRSRMNFLESLKSLDFDLFGRGFREIEDKWDALAPYHYTLAIENHRCPFYFTEKLMDAFLTWTVPIYYGCTNLESFFPRESYIPLDITSPDAVEKVRHVTARRPTTEQMDAIAEARRRVLDEYQLFPFLMSQIAADKARLGDISQFRTCINIAGTRLLLRRAHHKAMRLFGLAS